MSKVTGNKVMMEAKHFKIPFRYNFSDGTYNRVAYLQMEAF
jgi:hypothetical protein